MPSLAKLTDTFKTAVNAVRAPGRDELVAERDRLLGGPQPEYVDLLALQEFPPARPSCTCEHCRTAAVAATEARIRYAAHHARLETLRVQLHRLVFGSQSEQDAPGRELAGLLSEIRAAVNENDLRGQRWARRIESDRRGRPIKAFSTVEATVARGQALGQLIRDARDVAPFLNTTDLRQAIPALRGRLQQIATMPLEVAVPLEPAIKAGATVPRDDDTPAGLYPGTDPGILSGTVRFK
jgi:hypothetical protein